MAESVPKSQPLWLVPVDAEAAAPVLKKLPVTLGSTFTATSLQTALRQLRQGIRPGAIFLVGETGRTAQSILRQVHEIDSTVLVFLLMHWESEGAMRSWQSRLLIDSVQSPAKESLATPYNSYGLTKRELQVLRYMVQGLIKKEIAEQMSISYHTVNNHEVNIFRKLKIHTRSAAVAKALMEKIC